jgi:hypothetical protein
VKTIDLTRACYYQGRNGYGEELPSHAEFKPFFSFSFNVPVTTAEQFAKVLSWCKDVLGEREEGRWLEDFDYWHLGDPEAAEVFKAAWVIPFAKPSWAAPVVKDA